MTENFLWEQLKFVRGQTLKETDGIGEAEADQMPDGFRNTIRWHLGHIFTVDAQLVAGLTGQAADLPDAYPTFFARGTKPADWTEPAPSLSELRSRLQEQPNQLEQLFRNRLDDRLLKPFNAGTLSVETVGELLQFLAYHEALHLGFIKGLKRAIGL